WFRSTAAAKGIDWLSLVNPQHVKLILYALGNYSSIPYIPKPLLDAQKLSGITLIDNSTAKAEYSAAISFIKQYGHALIGSGPYILSQYSPQLSPPQAVLVKSPYFAMNVPDVITKPGRLFSISISIPSVISAGSSISGKVLQTLMGSSTSSPAPNVTVVIQITSAGKVLSTLITNTGSDGSFSLKIPSQLPAGRYNLIMYAYTQDSVLVYPYMYSTIVTPPPTTTMTTTTTLPTTTTLTTPPSLPTTTTTSAGGGISTSIIIAVVVIIIIIIIAVILLRRR
ncbi:MAG: peptide ABC transporter substrate-binding protein, partial [Sulfolobales archaeon]